MPTITTVDVAWAPGPVEFTDAEARRFDTAMFLGDGSNNGVRGGIVRHGDNSLAVSVNGSDQVTVQSGAAVIPAATGLGVYRAALSAPTSATGISSRNATNPRIDLVVFQIESGQGVVKTVDGTPSSSPTAPALPANAIELARLNVPALGGGAVTVTTSFRQYAAALGGTLVVETAARLPGSGNQKGQRAIALDTGLEHHWNGTVWQNGVIGYTSTVIGPANGNFTSDSILDRSGRVVTLHVAVTAGINVPANGDVLALPSGSLPVKEVLFWGLDNDTAVAVALRITTTGLVRHVAARTAASTTRGTVTFVAIP